ncbi:tRNA 2-selenouridine(34) synthase MnmH [Limnobacter litoralis]|uniref:tRNA 2-selenouridine synthase n=1 Tax=Limnobacter litoralis TaxID=481366 RepID=A0ABQ5YP03_9BURK|nr:tRNA 2-selenouridine(34) synthase MnmH [Limnobacter litoralis]GLR25651.1 tRNA 2-selenouridine synthase [Limnobacter litoralis]
MKFPEVVSVEQADQYEQVIDVRSPAEFALDHYPGAINCPVLDNEERIVVGTLYKQVSVFEAKKVGAALVARNIAKHLDEQFSKNPKEWTPLIYCWRGGNRSGAMTHILRQVGWRASQLDGGYKAFRRQVINELEILPGRFQWRVLSGETGSAKSRVLEGLAAAGAQVLDLEALACHKGSVLGILPDQPQPAQKMFETRIWDVLRKLDPARPVFVEAESKKVGQLRVPEHLFEQMTQHSTVFRIQASVAARVDFLIEDYHYFLADTDTLKQQLRHLVTLHGHEVIHHWCQQVDAAQWPELVGDLLVRHYDPAYLKSSNNLFTGFATAHPLPADKLDGPGIARLVDQLLNLQG